MSDQPRLCIHCEHHFRKGTWRGVLNLCSRLMQEQIDLVTGERNLEGPELFCDRERKDGRLCGPEGRYFQPLELNIMCEDCQSSISCRDCDVLQGGGK